MIYYIAMFDGDPIAVSEKSERHVKALAKAYMDRKFEKMTRSHRLAVNQGKITRFVTLEQR